MHTLIAFIRTDIKLKSIKSIYHWICLFMESKKIFVFRARTAKDIYVSFGSLFAMQQKQCSPSSFLSWNGLLLCQHRGIQVKHYTLIDLPIHGAQIEPSPIFVACFNREL